MTYKIICNQCSGTGVAGQDVDVREPHPTLVNALAQYQRDYEIAQRWMKLRSEQIKNRGKR